jgi:hypothetical protein
MVNDIEPFAEAGVNVVWLWPRWLSDPAQLVKTLAGIAARKGRGASVTA